MSFIASTALYPRGADSGQSIPGAFPLETEQAAESQKTQRARVDRLENKGKSGENEPQVGSFLPERKHQVEDHDWLKRLDALEAQPVKDNGLELQPTRHTRLSQRQLENYDEVGIMDAMERGEW